MTNEIIKTESIGALSTMDMLFNPQVAERIKAIAETMAKGTVTTPEHLRNKPADCLAITLQAAAWRLSPFAVAQKTHLIHGRLGYEAQLVNAVASSLGILEGRFNYEEIGDWSKVAKTPRKQSGQRGEYFVPGWTDADAEGLGIKVTGKLKGEAEPRHHTVWLVLTQPRNSGLWATAPAQQLSYVAVKQWVRKFAPDALLGVYTTDEITPAMRTIEGEVVGGESDTIAALNKIGRKEDAPAPRKPETEAPPPAQPAEDTQEEWPEKIGMKWVDSRGVIFSQEVHGWSGDRPAVNSDGVFKKRRNCDTTKHAEYEMAEFKRMSGADHAADQPQEDQKTETGSLADLTDAMNSANTGDDLEGLMDQSREFDDAADRAIIGQAYQRNLKRLGLAVTTMGDSMATESTEFAG